VQVRPQSQRSCTPDLAGADTTSAPQRPRRVMRVPEDPSLGRGEATDRASEYIRAGVTVALSTSRTPPAPPPRPSPPAFHQHSQREVVHHPVSDSWPIRYYDDRTASFDSVPHPASTPAAATVALSQRGSPARQPGLTRRDVAAPAGDRLRTIARSPQQSCASSPVFKPHSGSGVGAKRNPYTAQSRRSR